jgi:hypothetical protein
MLKSCFVCLCLFLFFIHVELQHPKTYIPGIRVINTVSFAVSQVRGFLNWERLVFDTSTKPVPSKTDESLVVFVWPNPEK